MAIAARLKELGIELPKVGAPLGSYVHAKRAGNLLYLSGKGPPESAGPVGGKLGAGVSVEEGYRHARAVGLVLIAAMRDALGSDLDRVEDIVKVLGMVNAAPDLPTIHGSSTAAPICLSRCSARKGGTPARRVGMVSLPGGIPVEIEVIVTVE